MEFANYGQNRDLRCTDGESEIFQKILQILHEANRPIDSIKFVRKSDSYVSACMESGGDYGLMDIARFKFTDRAKWIKIGPGFEKIALRSTDDVNEYVEELLESFRFNEPYL